MATRRALIDFVEGLLNLDPIKRWSPQQAAKHPFVTGEKFVGPFQVCRYTLSPGMSSLSAATYRASQEDIPFAGGDTHNADVEEVRFSGAESELWQAATGLL